MKSTVSRQPIVNAWLFAFASLLIIAGVYASQVQAGPITPDVQAKL